MDTSRCNNKLNQDPDYLALFRTDVSRQNIFETNARISAAKKISTIIEAEFLNEINDKKSEISKIFKSLNKACKMLHYLRFAIVTDFYNQENTLADDTQTLKQFRLHPTINPSVSKISSNGSSYMDDCFRELKADNNKRKRKDNQALDVPRKKISQVTHQKEIIYVTPTTNANYKTKRRIIVGNISKWIPPDFRENNASHKWTLYVRDPQKGDLGQFISKVRFFLHPSYKPNDVVELRSSPFHLCKHGWGEFPVRVQLHFANSFDKPVDIIHHLKLDRTFTGLQTIGLETVVDVWISASEVYDISDLEQSNNQNNMISTHDVHEEQSNIQNDLVSSDNECKEQINNQNDLAPTYSEHKEIVLVNHHFFNDHDYTGMLSQNNTPASKENLTANFEGRRPDSILKVSTPVLKKQELLNNLEQNDIGNFSKHSECKLENIKDTKALLLNSDINDKKIYLKNDNSIKNNVESSNSIISLIQQAKPNSFLNALKLIAQRLPLITEKATDPYYKILHPYASESYQVFSNYSKGKQQSLERYRAICALNILSNVDYNGQICSIKEFITWARRYCYTPCLKLRYIGKICPSDESLNIEDSKKYECTSTISHELNKWLLQCQKVKLNIENFGCNDDDQIDVINIPTCASDSLSVYSESKLQNNSIIIMEYPEQNSLNEFVGKIAQKIGIKLTNEEIVPGISHSSASLVITKAVQCLIDELIRLSFSCALDKCKAQKNELLIDSNDVRMALLKKEEFEIFTNVGLGSEG